jgi:uncharacterized protein involved in exopolysaccharide biosynthesis
MIQNREMKMDDYLAMLRRRAKIILIPALFALPAGFLVSYRFQPKFTSSSLILVESQKVPETMVQPMVSQDLAERVETLRQEVLAQSRLEPVVERLYPNKSSGEYAALIDQIGANMRVEPVVTTLSEIGTGGKPPKPGQSAVPGFYVTYTAHKALEAQQICNELTTLMIDQNLKSVAEIATGTSDVLKNGVDDAKNKLDDMDKSLAAFKKQYAGQLPGDEDSNLKILAGLTTQLEAITQNLNRMQQDKTYSESLLSQELAAWKQMQGSSNPQTLEKQLSDLQSVLLQLQARYTDDHPDVIKTKADIAGVKKKLAEINKASADAPDVTTEKASATEPPEIRQTRLQVHQYTDAIAALTRDQKRMQQEISGYQGRLSLSPEVEEKYKELNRGYDSALKDYQELLVKKSSADLTVKMNNQSQGERMYPLYQAGLPDEPSFPNRLFFAGGGLGAGLALGLALGLWLELRDNSIRNEADAEAALELPMLVAVPWVSIAGAEAGNGGGRFWKRGKKPDERKHTVPV